MVQEEHSTDRIVLSKNGNPRKSVPKGKDGCTEEAFEIVGVTSP
jgi:hypothetical protein